MFILIKHCEDGSFYPIEFLGSFESLEKARAAMLEDAVETEHDYGDWRHIEWSPDYTFFGKYYASLGLKGEGEIYEWYIFET